MNKRNFDAEADKIISNFSKSGEKPKLLLHACCAPCASAVIERMKDFFDVTVYFYNPNMDGEIEYIKRADELKRLCGIFDVKYVIEVYKPSEFISVVKGLENAAEGGMRCVKCFRLRLDKTAKFARENAFDYFTTTLTISPLKNAETLNLIGEECSAANGIKWLPSDFKKKGGYQRSVLLSKEFGLYRQNYCGCEFSKRVKLPDGVRDEKNI